MSAALYIHIPFCEKRCIYCDFYTIAGVNNSIPEYVDCLKNEIRLRASEEFWQQQKFETLFFGGGTPSLLSPAQIEALINCCHTSFRFENDAEITLEANPGTVSCEKLAGYRAAGVNRLSIGVQSFNPQELILLDRVHSPEQARATAQIANQNGFRNLNLDFIFALPGQTLEDWRDSLEEALKLDPTHLSTYNLTIEPGTPLDHAIRKGNIVPLDEEQERTLYDFTIEFLTAHGFVHYEVSNFSRSGYQARHNLKYWDDSPYLGLGASAHSYDGRQRFWNIANLRAYLDRLSNNKLATADEENLTLRQRMFEFAFLGLRQTRGVDLQLFTKKFGTSIETAFDGEVSALLKEGLLVQEDHHLRLTRAGLFLCDEICARLA